LIKQKPGTSICTKWNCSFSTPLTTNQYSNSLFNPGDYELRILFDENKNGIWDPGDFLANANNRNW
jgi:hypothetical protein